MNIRIFLLRSEHNRYAERLTPELRCVFADQLASEESVACFASLGDASDALRSAFADSHAILLLAEPSKYADTKKKLAASIGLPLRCDRTLYERSTEAARSLADDKSEFAVTHAYLPENARPFVSADWHYSGFAVTSGNQTVILMPLERGRTEVMLSGSVIPLLNSSYRIHADMKSLRDYHARQLSAVCQANDVRIAVAGTNAADYFREYISSVAELGDRVVFSEKAEKRGTLAPADYVVNLSITAAEFFGTSYGVAISNAFYSGSDPTAEKVIYLAITNDHETALREVKSVPGEDIPTLLARCCGDLCTFLSDIAGSDTKKRLADEENRKSLVSHYRRTIAIVAVIVVALAGFCFVYFRMHGYTLQTWAANAWSVVFPGSKPIFTTEPLTETPTTTEPSPETTSAVPETTSAPATTAAPTTAPATTASRGSSSGGSSSSGSSSGSSSSGSSSSGSSSSGNSSGQSAETTQTEAPSSAENDAPEETSPGGEAAETPSGENQATDPDEMEVAG